MREGTDQVRAWKDGTGDGADGNATGVHPAGDVRLPMSRGQVARTMVLAGLVVGLSAVSQLGTLETGTGTTTR
ncbi:hypothetical protein [Actinophytocola sp.]|uniref:hypothetical protein n=1 Tax=Actinophytocola sp. TaxID=1872138 RepID=UPI00389B1498